MQIHELNTFTGFPGATDYLAIDNGSETTKIGAANILSSRSYYGTNTSSATTTTLPVTCAGFVLTEGAMIAVKFTNAHTTTSASYLNVNSTGAKRILRESGSTQQVANIWDAGAVVIFVYDGTNWLIADMQADIDASVITLFTSLGWTQD